MQFLGRENERKRIERLLDSDRMETMMLYGRRRVGKSVLIKKVLEDMHITSVYYECKQTSEQNNVNSLRMMISESLRLPKLGFDSMEETLRFMFERSCAEPMILVIDEYPYIQSKVEGMDSILQSLIDEYKETSKLKLILCGSYVDVMEKLLEKSNPLYGRLHLVMELKPMDYYESQLFYPDFSPEDKVRIFSIFGGIPYYNQQVDDRKSVYENLMELIVEPGARLENEVVGYIQSEISKMVNANEVFEALARGYSRYSDIQAQSHVSSGPALAEVLKRLIQMDVVAKETPINDENNKKKTGYYISDNLSLFYYRYIFRYASQRNILNPDVFYERYIREDFESKYVPNRFEIICRQYLIHQNRLGRIEPAFDRIGKYYYDLPKEHRNGEFDVVTEDPNGYTFYEAKFRSAPMTEEMIRTEIEQVKATGLHCYQYGFFSRAGYGEIRSIHETLRLISLHEIYE